VADLVTVAAGQPASSNPRFARVLADGTVLVTASDYEGGRQGILFCTDGTTAGTQLVDTSLSIRFALGTTNFTDPWSRGTGPACFFNDLGEVWSTDATSRGTIRLAPQSASNGTVIAAPQGSPSIVTTADVQRRRGDRWCRAGCHAFRAVPGAHWLESRNARQPCRLRRCRTFGRF
jgi:hypothetical protein